LNRLPLVVANWKMNSTVDDGLALIDSIRQQLAPHKGVEVVLCPPFVTLPDAARRLKGSRIELGAQNFHWAEKGAFTGEVSALMLKPFARYVIIGHSERRQLFGESDETVNLKVRAALHHGLIPLICVGENLNQYESAETARVVRQQVRAALQEVHAASAQRIVLAYEPVWAIGSGKPATAAGANAVIGLTVRGALSDSYGEECAQRVRILYGGSVTPSNMSHFIRQPDIDGALVGGASLKADDFVAIALAAVPE
jgi:triosephosphate isomerase